MIMQTRMMCAKERIRRTNFNIIMTLNAIGDTGSVAHAKDGKWIYVFRPEGDHFSTVRLVDMKRHRYQLEPNVHFSPDGKWVIFRSNMFGPSNIFAVKL
jgi:oligogalacturonide lyase